MRRARHVDVMPERAALHGRNARLRVDTHPAQCRQVQQQGAIIDGASCNIVAAAAHGDRNPVLGGYLKRKCHIFRVGA